ncbi:MAG: glycosyltransferase family 39 protein [Cyanobacteria bacterium SZAS LIN-2]|nr:glycosyltransferase family 39 protein [Cyanobacteria bacterium SZAS LIN-2]
MSSVSAAGTLKSRFAAFFGAGVPAAFSNKVALGAIALFFCAVFAVATFGGDFPLNDDWSYGETTRTFLNTGRLYMPTACAVGFAHIGWGLIFAKLLGFSYVTLRISSIVAGLVGAFFAYLALLEIGLHRRESLFCALVYAANPIGVNLYLGFMSDGPALALAAAYCYYLLAALRRKSFKLGAVALLVLLLAITIRQSIVILALAAPAFLFVRMGSLKQRLLFAALFLLVPVLSFWAIDAWLLMRDASGHSLVDHYAAARAGHGSYLSAFLKTPLEQLFKTTAALGVVGCYLGLFLSPMLISLLAVSLLKIKRSGAALSRYRPSAGRLVCLSLALALFVCGLSAYYELSLQHALMPFCENVLRITSVGAQGIMGIANPILTPRQKMRLTIVSYWLAVVLLTQLFALLFISGDSVRSRLAAAGKSLKAALTGDPERFCSPQLLAVLICCFASIGFITVETLVRCTDRYYLIALLPTVLALAYFAKISKMRFASPFAWIVLGLFLWYSLAAAQDYLSSNAARWRGLVKLEAQGLKSSSIDGGAEYNIMRDLPIYASRYRGAPPRDSWRWWPIRGEEYIVSFSPIPEYDDLWQEKYYSFLTLSEHSVHVLKQMKLNK